MASGDRRRARVNTSLAELPRCACGKVCFPSAIVAKRMSSTMHNRVRVYICPESYKWHLTDRED